MMIEDVSEYVRELSTDLFANFIIYASPFHDGTYCTRGIHFYNGAFIFVKITTISCSLTICVICLRRWNSFKMSLDDSVCLLMFSNDHHRGSTESFRSSPDKAMIRQSLLSDEFPDWKVGEFGGGGGDFVCRGGDWGSPRAAQGVFAVPLVSVVVFTLSASVFPPPNSAGLLMFTEWIE